MTRALDVVCQGARRALPDEAKADVAALRKARKAISRGVSRCGRRCRRRACKTRIHGDYHLGQVLVAQNDVLIIDFEGEPQRGLAERRDKTSPLRDVAGMLRSFDYAAWSALDRLARTDRRGRPGAPRPRLRLARRGGARLPRGLLGGARRVRASCRTTKLTQALLDLFLIQKAVYEIQYEAANRPAWLSIPIRGLLHIIGRKGRGDG